MSTINSPSWVVVSAAPNAVAVFDATGKIVANSAIATSAVAANFVADHQIGINVGGTTYYFAASTVSW